MATLSILPASTSPYGESVCCRVKSFPCLKRLQGYINQAALKGEITEIQANDLRKSDIIIRAFDRTNRQEVYYTFEVSNTIGNADITRAVDRAATLGTVTGTPSYPAVIGSIIDGRQMDFAADRSVKVLPIPGAKGS